MIEEQDRLPFATGWLFGIFSVAGSIVLRDVGAPDAIAIIIGGCGGMFLGMIVLAWARQ